MVLGVPLTIAFTLRMLGFQVLFVLRFEWETACPKTTPFPQTLHFAILTPPKCTNAHNFIFEIYELIEHLLLYHILNENARAFLKKMKKYF